MPQMAPINWLFLFIMFTVIFLLFNMMNYYSILPTSPKSDKKNEFKSNSFNWKW
uniref:ATP synthase F0 subunit 8 n=1 Tax=Rhodesiella elegantula TaxID=3027663 RepID=UPI0023D88428|nr:ATP synthase F0 subunit 8 [Rhodesiella elegantula]WDA93987.1 ATP synthase F0 subunit 8 [Rhodesiella elegantula]